VANLGGLYLQYPPWSGHWFGTNPLAGEFPKKTRGWDPAAMDLVLAGLEQALGDAEPAVRRQAIADLIAAGKPAAPLFRARLNAETDTVNLGAMIQTLGTVGDTTALPALVTLLQDARRPTEVRAAALDALARFRDRQATLARLAIVYDRQSPPELLARAILALGRAGYLPPNDLATFLGHGAASVRVAVLWSLAAAPAVPDEVRQAILARFDDPAPEVVKAVISAAAGLRLRAAVDRLLALAQDREQPFRTEATLALTLLADPRAVPVYVAGLGDRSPEVRRRAEAALVAIRPLAAGTLEQQARAGTLRGATAEAVERILTPFRPVTGWRVIGPFPRTTARLFMGEPAIDFARPHVGAGGASIAWRPRNTEAATGRVVIDDLKSGAGDRGGFGYDSNGSPDLAAFGYAETTSDRDREALMLVGSSGTLIVLVNGQKAYEYTNLAGRPYEPTTDRVAVNLRKGTNRILVLSRQGIGAWSFSLQLAEPSGARFATRPGRVSLEALRSFALEHEGDPARGEAIFFDPRGVGCVQCHAAGGRGSASIGPDLTALGLKYDRAEIVRSVLEPSSRIATGYQPLLVATTDGQVVAGLLHRETATELELIDAEARTTRVLKSGIEERRVTDVSVMPTGLIDTLAPSEFSDLIAYLQSLRAPAPSAPASGR
jgi:putative heme-binding domain-containing protein